MKLCYAVWIDEESDLEEDTVTCYVAFVLKPLVYAEIKACLAKDGDD